MSYDQFSEDYINRTKELLTQYRALWSIEIENGVAYEITLALNCMLGLALFPKDKYFKRFKSDRTLVERIGNIIGVDYKGKDITFKEGIRAIRNTIAHMGDSRKRYASQVLINGEDVSETDKKIGDVESITFVCGDDEEVFRIEIDITKNSTALEEFLIKLCDEMNSNFT